MSAHALEEHVLVRDGVELHYWLGGVHDAPLVALTHGASMDHRMFEPQLNMLLPGCRVLLHDVRGHGRSQTPGSAFSVDAAVADLGALLDAIGARDAVLVGHSLGGTISQLATENAPSRVRAFVGVGSACATMRPIASMRTRSALMPAIYRLLGPRRIRRMSADQAGTSRATKAYAAEAIAAIPDDIFRAVVLSGFGDYRDMPAYRLGVPLLLLKGQRDAYAELLTSMPKWAERDGGRLVVIPGAGHNAGQDAPDLVNAELTAFLRTTLV
jgi:3-oxoadipate enol-lactonase